MSKTVVILGAGWAGLPLAHKLLKYTLPKCPQLKVVLVTPNSHFFWNVAAARAVIPGEIPNDQLFLPIELGFKQYSSSNFTLMLGKAEAVDVDENKVTVRAVKNGETSELVYDQLVIATGSHLRGGLPLKHIGEQEEMVASWKALQDTISSAKSILISGGGATGAEVAGEVAARYGEAKEITLVLSDSKPVSAAMASVRNQIDNDLQKLGVKLIRNARVSDTTIDGKQTKITLSNGLSRTVDLYLPVHGAIPNTSFLPSSLLDSDLNLQLDNTLRVSGTKNIWGIGDVGNLEPKQLTVTDQQIIHLANALDVVVTGNGQVAEYKKMDKTMIFVALGRRFATGQIGGWKVFGWLVAWIKGRKLFVDTAKGYVDGKHLRHAAM